MQRKEKATSTDGLKNIARQAGRGITQEYLKNLYQSIQRQMQPKEVIPNINDEIIRENAIYNAINVLVYSLMSYF